MEDNKRLLIKVCGMHDEDNMRAVASLDIDMMGFIFYPKSPRYVSQIMSRAGIIPDYSKERLRQLQGDAQQVAGTRQPKRVGVFVDDMPQTIVTRVFNYRLDFVQLNGDESPVMIENLKRTLIPDITPQIGIIKTLHIASAEDIEATRQFDGVVDYFLFDTPSEDKGGNGTPFDWTILDGYQGRTPFLLSGGIGPEDVKRIKAFQHPMFAGVDVNSEFETEPGIKDVGSLRGFVDALRKD